MKRLVMRSLDLVGARQANPEYTYDELWDSAREFIKALPESGLLEETQKNIYIRLPGCTLMELEVVDDADGEGEERSAITDNEVNQAVECIIAGTACKPEPTFFGQPLLSDSELDPEDEMHVYDFFSNWPTDKDK